MSSTRKTSERLLALASAALALPGIAHAADTGYRSDDIVLNYNHGEYKESGQRMDIHVDQLAFSAPIGEHFETRLEAIRDVTSGASPTYYTVNSDGSPAMILQSGASIRDQRDVYRAGLGYYGDRNYYGVGLGRSREDDYEANFGSVDFRRTFDNKNTTLLASADYSSDVVWNTYDPNNILNEPSVKHDRRKHNMMVGVSQVMDRNTVMQFNLTHSYAYGHLSDPYKLAQVENAGLVDIRGDFPYDALIDFINYTSGAQIDDALAALGVYNNLAATGVDVTALRNTLRNSTLGQLLGSTGLDIAFLKHEILGALSDNRPDSRRQWIALWRYSHFIESNSSAIHIDYRYAHDAWHSNSHTIEAKWKKSFGDGWMIAPGLRYYDQQSAYFYDTYFSMRPSNGYLSSDYRLAGFGAISAKFEISKAVTKNLSLQFNYEYYKRKREWEWLSHSVGDDVDDYNARTYTVSLESVF